MTIMITITLKTSSSLKTVPRWLEVARAHPPPHKAMAVHLFLAPPVVVTLSSLRIKRCRTYLMEIAQTKASRSSGSGRKTCSDRTTSRRCGRWSSVSASTGSTRPAPLKVTRPEARGIQMREAPRAPIRTWALAALVRASLPARAFSKLREAII